MMVALLDVLSPSMLGWLVAAILPWWIHRWWSHRPQEVPWAAMQLLRQAIREQSRQVRFWQWLLLALRTLILLLVALAAAQPVLRQGGWNVAQDERLHLLLLVDLSYSMGSQFVGENGQSGGSRLAQARKLARQTIRSAPRGSLFTVLGWSGNQHGVGSPNGFGKLKKAKATENGLGPLAMDAAAALLAVDQLQVNHTSAQLNTGLQAALQVVLHAKQVLPEGTSHQVCVVSDMGSNTWADAATSDEVQTLCQQLQTQGELWVLPLESMTSLSERDSNGNSHELVGNVAMTGLTIDPPLALAGKPLTIEASLRAFGPWSNSVTHVELSIDGQLVDRQPLDLSVGEEGVIRFETQLVDPGQHVVHVACQPHDDLPLDNEHWRMVEARQQVQVLCLEGHRAAADDLTRALMSHGPSSQSERFSSTAHRSNQPLFHVEQIAASRLAEIDLLQYEVVLVCNVAQFHHHEADRLIEYVRNGGALLLFLGDRGNTRLSVTTDTSNRQGALASSKGPQSLLQIPVQIGSAIEVQDVHWNPLEYRHPLVGPFRDHPNSGLTQVTVAKYCKLTLLRSDQYESVLPAWSTALAFDTGDPAIVIGPLGLGRVAVVALPGSLAARTAAGTPWSSWAISPSFLPLVRELLKQVIGRDGQDQFNRLVGEPLELRMSNFGSAVAATKWLVKTPLGQNILSTDRRVLLPTTDLCGIYSLLSNKSPNRVNFRFAVNLLAIDPDTGRGESDLATVRPNQLPPVLSLLPPVGGRSGDKELPLGRMLFGSALISLLCEQWLAWSIGKSWG